MTEEISQGNSPVLLQAAPSVIGGGLQGVVRSLAEEGSRRGWRSIVCYWRRQAPEASAAEYVRVPSRRPLTWTPELLRLVRLHRPDIVHLHGPIAGSVGAVVLRLSGIRRIVYTDHSVHSQRPVFARVLRRLASRAPLVSVGVSEAVAQDLMDSAGVPRERVATIRNGVPIADPLEPPAEQPQFVYVAHLWPWKGHATLLDAFALLPANMGLRLTLIGEGPERARIEHQIRRLKLGSRVDLLGYRRDPWSNARGAWAYVHPSHVEGIGLAVMEAMMRGLPVIAARAGGVPEVVTAGETGLLVPPGDPPAMSRALLQLANDRPLRDRLAAKARQFALSELQLDTCIERYFDLYLRILEQEVP
jgi:glycosyltransferase involved in cell wall biosynthesis